MRAVYAVIHFSDGLREETVPSVDALKSLKREEAQRDSEMDERDPL